MDPQDTGLEGKMGALEKDAGWDRKKGLLAKLDGGTLLGVGAKEAENAARMGRYYC